MKNKTALILSFSIVLSALMVFIVPRTISSSTTDYAIAIGTKFRYLWGQSNYTFVHNTSIVFEAPEITDWTFDHIEVDFGCEVGGVTGSNVSEIFTIDNGYIQECMPG